MESLRIWCIVRWGWSRLASIPTSAAWCGRWSRKYGMNPRHVRKVADLAHVLFDGLRDVHQLPLRQGKLLDAAAYLYNIGHFVNEARHHRHSMYIVANSDMPDFPPKSAWSLRIYAAIIVNRLRN